MPSRVMRTLLYLFAVLLVPIGWLAGRYDPYQVDGDAVNYMDLADMVHAHNWHGLVNSYWHPLYPAALALGQVVFHTTRANELHAYYGVNYAIFLLEAAAMFAFVTAMVRLRCRGVSPASILESAEPLLSLQAMRLLGLGLLVVAVQRELSMGKIRPDALLQALMLGAFAALLSVLGAETFAATAGFAVLAGILFGLAYLTKSFALAVTLLSIAVIAVSGVWLERRTLRWAAAVVAFTVVPFACIAGPWVGALSHKYGHLDFGDSGGLNFAWYAGDTEKMHLEPWMTDEFGTATVRLTHPEQQLMRSPGVYSYKAVPEGTYPDWMDPAYFNAGVKPHTRLKPLLRRDARNVVLVVRYLFNHPEAWVLLLLLLLAGGRAHGLQWRRGAFWLPMLVIGLAMWALYGLVNIEERYVTLAYLVVVLPVFALLREPALTANEGDAWPRRVASAMVVVFAFLALGESLRVALEERRLAFGTPTWHSQPVFDAATALEQMGVHAGDEIACMGVTACLHDYYWARLDGARITTEIYAPETDHLLESWEDLPNHDQAAATLRDQGAKVLVAYFKPGERAQQPAEALGWRPLGESGYWALPLTLTPAPAPPVEHKTWVGHAEGNQ